MNEVKLIECPRDAMQGLSEFIPTQQKADYINQLLKVGFDTIDFGSFVSPKAIPQLRDTAEVLSKLELSVNDKLLAIVANERGAEDASHFDEISYLGFPFSISETFQQRNTNSSIQESIKRVEKIHKIAHKNGKELVLYISMAFGNPYGDEWNAELAIKYANFFEQRGITILSLADTVGVASPESISYMFDNLIKELPEVEFGAHLHANPTNALEKIEAAYNSGCRRFDSAMKGFGGCPMAEDKLVGNLPTELLVAYLEDEKVDLNMDTIEFGNSLIMADKVFPKE
jgi:hydroxymethylglutaryl-CoA lyase